MQRTSETLSSANCKKPLTVADFFASPIEKNKDGILLVSKNSAMASPIWRLVEKCGAEPVWASPLQATSEYVKRNGYTLVLLESSAPPDYRRQLVSDLLGSSVTLFYAYSVEIGCWWLPALLYGEDCHGRIPAFRASQLLLELPKFIQRNEHALVPSAGDR